jgi:hypothetical protein
MMVPCAPGRLAVRRHRVARLAHLTAMGTSGSAICSLISRLSPAALAEVRSTRAQMRVAG